MDESSPQQPMPSPAGAPGTRSRFEPGDVIAGSWRITRQLGAMRLDEIYEGTSIVSGDTVALRVIRRDDGRDDATFRRFSRVARRLSATRHPNVQRILGLATHESETGGVRERVVLLATEIVNGETLTHRVRRSGPLRGEAAEQFAREFCEGLDAIHRARVLHGDITGTSVVFASSGDGTERVVITDLAFLSSGEGDDQAMARAVGSPAYRAPEQITGRKLHRASDIFSLGAVIYEAFTARLPFTGGNLLALDFRQLEEKPRNPGEVVPGLDPNQGRAILRCLARAPEDRFERASEVLEAMRGRDVATPRFRQTVRTLGAASLLITLMIGGSAFLSWVSFLEDRRLGVERVLRSRPAIAVMPIRPYRLSDRDAWVPVAVAELLRLELARDDGLRVAPREAVTGAVADLSLRDVEALTPEALHHLLSLAGAEQVVVGSCALSESGGVRRVSLDLCLQDARTGETVGTVFESGLLSGLPDLAARVAERIRPIIGAPASQRGPGSPKIEEWSSAGLEAYSRGLSNLDEKRAAEAVSALRLAATTDAGNPTVRLALSQAWWISGDLARAIDEAKRAWDASEGLSRERSMELELRHAELRADRARAMEVYRRLIRNYPDRIDHGLGLVGALIRAQDFDEARRALQSMRSATSTPRDPRVELATARLESQSGRFAEALAAAEAAAELAEELGARALFAEALIEKSWAAAATGDMETATTSLERATEVFRSRGDVDEVARLTAMRASLENQAGRFDAAIASLEESERIYTTIGQRQGVAATRGSIALLLASRGRHHDAAQHFAAAIEGFVAVGDHENATRSRIGLAESLRSLGALSAAEAQLRAALSTPQSGGEPLYRGLALLERARLETERGNVARSNELLRDAAAVFQERRFGDGLREVEILRGVDAWLAGDATEAKRILLATMSQATTRGDDTAGCRAALALARIDATSGDAAAALSAAEGCVETLAAHASPSEATMARAVGAIAALRVGDRSRARTLLDGLGGRTASEEDFVARATTEIALARWRGTSASKLMELAASASDASMRLVELDALLAAADLAGRSGDGALRTSALERAEALARRRELVAYTRLVDAARASAPR
ncbi:MAG: protein kinase [Thermoanaerobaculia bacterium]|nr:protein kinase [Thermoanaerobaculia bacterium]